MDNMDIGVDEPAAAIIINELVNTLEGETRRCNGTRQVLGPLRACQREMEPSESTRLQAYLLRLQDAVRSSRHVANPRLRPLRARRLTTLASEPQVAEVDPEIQQLNTARARRPIRQPNETQVRPNTLEIGQPNLSRARPIDIEIAQSSDARAIPIDIDIAQPNDVHAVPIDIEMGQPNEDQIELREPGERAKKRAVMPIMNPKRAKLSSTVTISEADEGMNPSSSQE